MDPMAEARSSCLTADSSVDAVWLAVNTAQSDCICRLHLCVCLLTDTGEKAGLQPFLYEEAMTA
jgi:hypothetical protein